MESVILGIHTSISDPGHTHTVAAAREKGKEVDGSPDETEIAEDSTRTTSRNTTGISILNRGTGISISNAGSGSGHTHSFTGSNFDLDVKFSDVIIAEKN